MLSHPMQLPINNIFNPYFFSCILLKSLQKLKVSAILSSFFVVFDTFKRVRGGHSPPINYKKSILLAIDTNLKLIKNKMLYIYEYN